MEHGVVPVGFNGAVVEIAARRRPASQQLLFLLQSEAFWVIQYEKILLFRVFYSIREIKCCDYIIAAQSDMLERLFRVIQML